MIKSQSDFWAGIHLIIQRVMVVFSGLLVFTALLCRFGDGCSPYLFGLELFLMGIGAVCFGCLGLVGAMQITGDFKYLYSLSVSGSSSVDRAILRLKDLAESNLFLTVFELSGLLALLLGKILMFAFSNSPGY